VPNNTAHGISYAQNKWTQVFPSAFQRFSAET